MSALATRSPRFFQQALGARSRAVLVAAAIMMSIAYFLPLWNLTMFAPQYPHGLRLDIYDHGLVGGNDGQDVKEINVLNHYIGMRDLSTEDFTEFNWMPFALGARRTAASPRRGARHRQGNGGRAVSCSPTSERSRSGRSAIRLYHYGHDLAPTAPVKVDPFMPPMFGYQQIANFEVYSYPRTGIVRAGRRRDAARLGAVHRLAAIARPPGLTARPPCWFPRTSLFSSCWLRRNRR